MQKFYKTAQRCYVSFSFLATVQSCNRLFTRVSWILTLLFTFKNTILFWMVWAEFCHQIFSIAYNLFSDLIPQQMKDSKESGVFLCQYAKCYSRNDDILFKLAHMKTFRHRSRRRGHCHGRHGRSLSDRSRGRCH